MSNTDQIRATIIGEDVEITGSIKCENNIQIDGKLNGDLICNTTATIGNTASVKGNLTVETITIYGQINGNINAKDKIELMSTARMHGDIRARRLTVEDGVTFVGKAEVNPTGQQNRQNAAGAAPTAAAATENKSKTESKSKNESKSDTADEGEQNSKGIFRR
jgi:cytoskeletal protein CcmA (bactofilin family)